MIDRSYLDQWIEELEQEIKSAEASRAYYADRGATTHLIGLAGCAKAQERHFARRACVSGVRLKMLLEVRRGMSRLKSV